MRAALFIAWHRCSSRNSGDTQCSGTHSSDSGSCTKVGGMCLEQKRTRPSGTE